MNRRLLKLLYVILLAAAALIPSATLVAQLPPKHAEQPKEQSIYVTRTGKRYHRANCRYLARSKFEMSLKEAKQQGYTPCKVCRPPQ
jgi:hypothetical protein